MVYAGPPPTHVFIFTLWPCEKTPYTRYHVIHSVCCFQCHDSLLAVAGELWSSGNVPKPAFPPPSSSEQAEGLEKEETRNQASLQYGLISCSLTFYFTILIWLSLLLRAYPLQDVAAQMHLQNWCVSSATLVADVIVPNISVMSFSHLCSDFPLLLFPATIPCIIVFSKPFCRVTWRKYLSFWRLTKLHSQFIGRRSSF